MEDTLLALANAALFALQLFLRSRSSSRLKRVSRRLETLISPAPRLSRTTWKAIYALVSLVVICDVVAPTLTLFNTAPHPNLLRLLFSLACIADCVWTWTLANGWIHEATLAVSTQWVALWTLYLSTSFIPRPDELARGPRFVALHVSGIAVAAYALWTCFAMLESFAMSMQKYFQSCLSFASYATLLCVLGIVVNWCVIFYFDFWFGLIGAWAFIVVSLKNSAWESGAIERLHDSVQEAAVQVAVTTATILTIRLALLLSK